jgi:hypothetical protein
MLSKATILLTGLAFSMSIGPGSITEAAAATCRSQIPRCMKSCVLDRRRMPDAVYSCRLTCRDLYVHCTTFDRGCWRGPRHNKCGYTPV